MHHSIFYTFYKWCQQLLLPVFTSLKFNEVHSKSSFQDKDPSPHKRFCDYQWQVSLEGWRLSSHNLRNEQAVFD